MWILYVYVVNVLTVAGQCVDCCWSIPSCQRFCVGLQLADVKHQLVTAELKSYAPGIDSEKKQTFRLVCQFN